MPIPISEVLKNLSAGEFAGLYFLHGEEPFYIDAIVSAIEKYALKPTEKDFNQAIIYGKEVTCQQIVERARQFPVMNNKRVIIIKQAQEIEDIHKKLGREILVKYAENQADTTILVLACRTKQKLLAKRLSVKKTIVLESPRIYDNQLANEVRKYCQQNNIAITPRAIMVLVQYVGTDLTRVVNEINKILLSCDKPIQITDALVLKYVGISKQYNVFELKKAIAKKNAITTFGIIYHFEANPKAHPIVPIISILYLLFSQILIAYQHRNLDANGLQKAIGGNYYDKQDVVTARRYFSWKKHWKS